MQYARFPVGKSRKNRVTDKESKGFAYLCTNLNDWGMSDIIIGRKAEQEILRQRIESKSPELIAIHGRRRIGKTYLISMIRLGFTPQAFIKERRRNNLVSSLVS